MFRIIRFFIHAFELLLAVPVRAARFLLFAIMLNPRLGPLRHLATALTIYVGLAALLVYVVAPIRGYVGHLYQGQNLRYASERWLATGIYDRAGNFIGTFDPRLDSKRDVNFTGKPIELSDTGYVANPDHKSIPVREVPQAYWNCLAYHEDRHIGTWLNPFGIDLVGVLKIPYSTVRRSIAKRGISFGVGGSTLPMQLARVIYKTPPHSDESGGDKIRRKLGEWWDAPVIYWELTKDGDQTPLQKWAADHLWLAQRTGGQPLHGIETTSRVVFGKQASQLSVAEQFVLASAVNKPIILLEGSDRLNAVRIDRWRYIVDVRARKCAGELITDPAEQKAIWFELTAIAGGPPDPQVKPEVQQVLEEVAPLYAKVAEANPAFRANILIPDGRYGVREELKNEYGYGWREYVRGVQLSFNAADNRRFRETVKLKLAELQKTYQSRIDPAFSLDLNAVQTPMHEDKLVPDVVIVAANEKGEIVRYFEAKDNAAYFGSELARDNATGRYDPTKETRAIASIGKMMAAIAIANEGRDDLGTQYTDVEAPKTGLESCNRGGKLTRGRTAEVSFACSLNRPIEWRLGKMSQSGLKKMAEQFGFNMPYAPTPEQATPASTAIVRGFVTGSPRKVHQLAGVILAALTGRGASKVPLPSLMTGHDQSSIVATGEAAGTGDAGSNDSSSIEVSSASTDDLVPDRLIRPMARELIRQLLSAPLCYSAGKVRHGTLKDIADWCAERNPDIKLHFAKTGTHVNEDPDATVDVWAAGGIQFTTGQAYTYVVMVGTGNSRRPWARRLHSAQIATPLLEVLLNDLAAEAKKPPLVAAAGAAQAAQLQ